MSETTDLDSFWQFLSRTVEQLITHHNSDDVGLVERLVARADDCVGVLQAILLEISEQSGTGANQTRVDFIALIEEVQRQKEHYESWIVQIEPHCSINPLSNACPLRSPTGHRGRPAYDISKNDLDCLFEMGFSYQQSARIIGVSERTLRRRREEFGLPVGSSYTDMSDDALDGLVRSILEVTLDSGLCYVRGSLLSRGVIVQRQRVIESLRRVDPVSQSLRRIVRVQRRDYWVPGPNALWHVDGHHKLIRWKFVIHGGIDGFSRLMVYLRCSNNNLASTVMESFHAAVDQYGVPSRVRSDLGVENVEIARFMITTRGPSRGSIITGSSTHNQRVERMWRDVHRVVVRQYKNLFRYMEATGCLDPLNDTHLFALHHVYMPCINRALEEFIHQHNHHRLRTEHNLTPTQMFLISPRTIDPMWIDWNTYGVDVEGPVPSEHPDYGVIVVPPQVHVTSATLTRLPSSLSDDGNFGINLYLSVLDMLFQ